MKLRLVEEHNVTYNSTLFVIQRHAGGWFDGWKSVNSYVRKSEAEETFNRLKQSRGEYLTRTVLEQWP